MFSLEYIAGYFDGEGHVTVDKYSMDKRRTKLGVGYRIAVTITNTHLPTLQELQKRYGGKIVGWHPTGGKRMGYSLRWYGENARNFLRILLPYLHEKKEQAVLALSFPLLGHHYNQFHAVPQELIEERERIYQQIKKLKRVEYLLPV